MLKKFKPTTSSRRSMRILDYKHLLSGHKPLKSLLKPLKKLVVVITREKLPQKLKAEEIKDIIELLILNET